MQLETNMILIYFSFFVQGLVLSFFVCLNFFQMGVQTSLMINEMINLEHEIVNNRVKLKERPGMRKDRFSSLEYNYYVTQQLALKLKPKQDFGNLVQKLTIRPARRISSFSE